MQTPLASVVLLEDEPDDALFVRRALAKARIINPIIAFANAEQARRYFDESRRVALPALFILDVKLGGSETGVAFLRWLRQQRLPLGSTPTMMLTGSQSLDDRDEAELLGSIYFLQKPISEAAIMAAVQSLGSVVTTLSGVTIQRTIERQL